MRVALIGAVLLLTGCASERLSVNPPAGIDFTGKWKLNQAESDDPMQLFKAQNADKQQDPSNPGGDSPQPRGRRGRGMGPNGAYGAPGPQAPPLSAMSGPLRWPGKELEVKQVAGVVAFTSDQQNRVCQPDSDRKAAKKPDPRDRSAPAAHEMLTFCGWTDATLVVHGGLPDEGRGGGYEEHYDLSADRQRLVETIVFLGGRSNGYTLSRVWDRVSQ
ncbi:MAG TPA: hypothetical protein VGI93_11205 [Steroidobacteraceae bacterium]|jgi:hypothetical protein